MKRKNNSLKRADQTNTVRLEKAESEIKALKRKLSEVHKASKKTASERLKVSGRRPSSKDRASKRKLTA